MSIKTWITEQYTFVGRLIRIRLGESIKALHCHLPRRLSSSVWLRWDDAEEDAEAVEGSTEEEQVGEDEDHHAVVARLRRSQARVRRSVAQTPREAV